MGWFLIGVFVLSLVVSYAFAPKPQSAPPPGIGEIQTPTAEEGREIPVVFGTVEIEGCNVLWSGDFKIVPIKKKGGKK
jgi:hypothetical protein